MGTVAAVILAVALSSAAASAANPSKEALTKYYSANGSSEFDVKRNTVELCPDNTCEFYQLRSVAEPAAWDTIFLHQYYFVAPDYREEFRAQTSAHAESLLAKYAHLCPSSNAQPKCIIGKLAARHNVRVAFVTYDEGYRCQASGRLTDPKYLSKGKCTKVKSAS